MCFVQSVLGPYYWACGSLFLDHQVNFVHHRNVFSLFMQSAYNAQVFFSRNPQLLIWHFSLSVFQYSMSLFTIFMMNLQCSLDSAGMQILLFNTGQVVLSKHSIFPSSCNLG